MGIYSPAGDRIGALADLLYETISQILHTPLKSEANEVHDCPISGDKYIVPTYKEVVLHCAQEHREGAGSDAAASKKASDAASSVVNTHLVPLMGGFTNSITVIIPIMLNLLGKRAAVTIRQLRSLWLTFVVN